MKFAALAFRALYPYLSSHHSDQTSRNGQAQPSPSVLTCGAAVGLGKGLEEQFVLLRRNSDASVTHREFQFHPSISRRTTLDLDQHFALLRKLDGIAHQIYQHLTNPSGIPD